MWVGVNMEENWKMLQSWIGRERASWGKREKKEEAAPIVDRKRKNELEQREKKEEAAPIVDRKRKSKLGQKREKGEDAPIVHRRQRGVLGGEVIKQRKMLQVRSGSEKASWGKSSGMGKTPQ